MLPNHPLALTNCTKNYLLFINSIYMSDCPKSITFFQHPHFIKMFTFLYTSQGTGVGDHWPCLITLWLCVLTFPTGEILLGRQPWPQLLLLLLQLLLQFLVVVREHGPQLNFLNFVFAGDVIVNLSVCTVCTGSQGGGRGLIDPATDVTRWPPCLTLCDLVWPCVTLFDLVWPCVTLFDLVWSSAEIQKVKKEP